MALEDSENSDPGAKRRLNLVTDLVGENVDLPQDHRNKAIPMIMDGSEDSLANEANTTRTKHSKKAGANSPSLGSAGSLEESVRSQ
jgi:hypothetical protein